ncbi:MAG: electron transfer flavoprotein subunit alpha/FixB family protein [Desulfobacteraceae bacterium]
MGEIFVLVEHRQGEIRDISYEMLWKADELCRNHSHQLTAVVLGGKDAKALADGFADRADKVLVAADERLEAFDVDLYKEVLLGLIQEHKPFLVMMPHSPWGMDLAPAISMKTGCPLATDCVDILVENERPKVVRQIYTGKIYSKVSMKESGTYLIAVRASAFPPEKPEEARKGEVVEAGLPAELPESRRRFVAFEDVGAGEVDITQAELLVSVGRGVGEQENIEVVKELAEKMGGMLACSRPVVDKNWLPKYHQVGTSGKSVKPKVYLALGISGAFQHVAGISGAGTVIAVNKDAKAPIFRVADYGVVDDLFNVVEAVKEKLS